MLRSRNPWSGLMMVASAALALPLLFSTGCDEDIVGIAAPTSSSSSSSSAGGSSSATGGGGTGGSSTSNGGGGGAPPVGSNIFSNGDFELFSAGANPPFDPPDDWVTFGAAIPFSEVGYDNYATQAHDAPIFNPADPNDQSNLYPGYMTSRGLKVFGRNLDAGGSNLDHTLGTVYQEFSGGTVPSGSKLMLSGWAYVSSVDPLGADNSVYLVIKCFPDNFGSEFCGGGSGMMSTTITSATPTNTWTQFSATVDELNAAATIVQAGVEFEQCAAGPCSTGGGAVFWDDLHFSWE